MDTKNLPALLKLANKAKSTSKLGRIRPYHPSEGDDNANTSNATVTQSESTSTQSGNVYNTGGAGLNVRQGPGTNYQRIGGLSEGAEIKIIGKEGDWYRIQFGTSIGFVSGKYVKLTTGDLHLARPGNKLTTDNSNNTSNDSDTDSSGKSNQKAVSGQSDPIGTATITKNAVNVRLGPSTSYERMGGLTAGKSVQVYEERAGWIRIQYGDQEGWIYRAYTDFATTFTGLASGNAELADFIRDNFPNGFTICFAYNGSDQAAEFASQANQFSKTYNSIGISSGALGKQIYRKITKYSELKSIIIDTVNSVCQCLADNPRPGFDDSKCSSIKNLCIMCHGYETGLNLGGGSSNNFKIGSVEEFAATTKGYLNTDVRVQLYACSTARRDGTSENWFERRGTNGDYGADVYEQDPYKNGEGSFAQKLAEALGEDASVYGHTTAGHLSSNYCARCYGKDADHAANGKHMFDVYFPQSFVVSEAARLGWTETKTRTQMYVYYMNNFAGDCSGRDTFIDPEGKGERMRAGWTAAH